MSFCTDDIRAARPLSTDLGRLFDYSLLPPSLQHRLADLWASFAVDWVRRAADAYCDAASAALQQLLLQQELQHAGRVIAHLDLRRNGLDKGKWPTAAELSTLSLKQLEGIPMPSSSSIQLFAIAAGLSQAAPAPEEEGEQPASEEE